MEAFMVANQSKNMNVYAEVVKALVLDAVADMDTVEVIGVDKREKKGLKACAVNVYILPSDKVTIDVFVNLLFGNDVPDVVSKMQQKIKEVVESSTKYAVHSVNVQVVSINFPKPE